MGKISFLHPEAFFLLILLLPLVVWYFMKNNDIQASMQLSTLKGFARLPKSNMAWLRHAPFVLRILATALIITIIARPQSSNRMENKICKEF